MLGHNIERFEPREADSWYSMHVAMKNATPQRTPSRAEILSALSYALDMTDGQPKGHAVRTCYIAQRIGTLHSISKSDHAGLFYAGLLKDSGCSADSTRIQEMFSGVQGGPATDDWNRSLSRVRFGDSTRRMRILERARQLFGKKTDTTQLVRNLAAERCDRGAKIAKHLGFNETTVRTIKCIDERWDGSGAPNKLSGEHIPLLARILCLSQTLEVFASEFGLDAAYTMLEQRNGHWFDPTLVKLCDSLREDACFWDELSNHRKSGKGLSLVTPEEAHKVPEADIDAICRAFAGIVDAKSDYTSAHSARVAEYALSIATEMNVESDRLQTIRRAALLHDIGKLGVATSILDKAASLTESEYTNVKAHSRQTGEILNMVPGFQEIAEIAGGHHERINGKGYHRGLTGDEVTLGMRILAVADVFDALTAKRPYRNALPISVAFEMMEADPGLDQKCIAALKGISVQNEEGHLHLFVRG